MTVEELLEQVDIVDYISQYVELERKGDEWWGISPFTEPPEKTPSFSVRREKRAWFDFSSGRAGNALTFTKFYFGCDGREAFDRLAEYLGLEGEELVPRNKLTATSICKQFKAQKKYEKTGTPIKLPSDFMNRYDSSLSKVQLWRDEGISDEILQKFQVSYDSFSNRIVYPIRDASGTIVNIGGRALDRDYKEKGQRKYCYFYKWPCGMNLLYGLYENRESILQKREIILFEGCKSVLKAASWGVDNCAALLTSHLSQNQMKILLKLGVNTVFALDRDVNVRADHNIGKLRSYCSVYYLLDSENLLEEKDSPVDRGFDVFQTLYEGRLRYR